jgi:hypothetical protein
MKGLPFLFVPVFLFAVGALYAFYAEGLRDYTIRQLNSRWYIPLTRATGIFMMLVAVASAAVLLANIGVSIVWPHHR